jgi:hypothetical protein
VSEIGQSAVRRSWTQAMEICSAPDTKRLGDCLQGEDLTTMAHMEGSNPLAPTNFLEKRAEFSLLDHSVPSEWSFPQIALGAGI